MSTLELSQEDKKQLVESVRTYMLDVLGHELGRFEAEFFVEHLAAQMAPVLYNRALRDAQAIVQQRVYDLVEAIDALEK